MEKVITFGLKIKNDNTTHRTVCLHHPTLPTSTKIISILIFWLFSHFQHLSLTQFSQHPVHLALRLYLNTGAGCPAAAVRPWPTKPVLKLAQRVSSEKTTPLLLVSRIQLLTTRWLQSQKRFGQNENAIL